MDKKPDVKELFYENDTRNIYVASSWKNSKQPEVVRALRQAGHEVYDFRNPALGDNGFHWSQIDPAWQDWSPERFVKALSHPVAEDGFALDWFALKACDVCVLVLPCGRSAHLELGFAIGEMKHSIVLLEDGCEPELTYKLVNNLCCSIEEVLACLQEGGDSKRSRPRKGWRHNGPP